MSALFVFEHELKELYELGTMIIVLSIVYVLIAILFFCTVYVDFQSEVLEKEERWNNLSRIWRTLFRIFILSVWPICVVIMCVALIYIGIETLFKNLTK